MAGSPEQPLPQRDLWQPGLTTQLPSLRADWGRGQTDLATSQAEVAFSSVTLSLWIPISPSQVLTQLEVHPGWELLSP